MDNLLYTLAAAALVKEAFAPDHLARLDQLARIRESGAHRFLDPEEVANITGEHHNKALSWAKAIGRGALTGIPIGIIGGHIHPAGIHMGGMTGAMIGGRMSRHNTALGLLDRARQRVLQENRNTPLKGPR